MSRIESQNKAPSHSRVQPPAQLYLLSLLDCVEVYLNDMVLQPTNEQCAAVCQQETVHVLRLVHAVGEDSPHTPAQLGEAVGKGVEDLPSPSPTSSLYTASRGAGTISPSTGGRYNPPAARGRHSQVVKNDEAPPGHVLQVGFGQKKDTILQALDLADVITAVHLEGGVSLQRRAEERGSVALKPARDRLVKTCPSLIWM